MNKNNLLLASFAFLLMVGHIAAQDHLWTFDENQGTIAYDSRGGRRGRDRVNGNLNNAQWRDLSKVGPGACVRVTGADNSFVTFGTAVGQFGRSDFTVAFWFQTTDTSGLGDLVGNRVDPGHGNWFAVRLTGDGYVSAEVDQDASGTNYIGFRSQQGRLNDGQWHQVVVVREGNYLDLYIDGQYSNGDSARGTADIRNNRPFKIGRSLIEPGTRKFAPDALFDDLAIYNQAISENQINALYNSATNQ